MIEHDNYWQVPELKSVPSGEALLNATPENARRTVLAAVAQTNHWDEQANQIRAQARTDYERMNCHTNPEWGPIWARRLRTAAVISALMRRALPLQEVDLLAILDWCASGSQVGSPNVPAGAITRALERFSNEHTLSIPLRDATATFAVSLRTSYLKTDKKLGTDLEQILASQAPVVGQPAPPGRASSRPVQPAPVGHPAVLTILKQRLGLLPAGAPAVESEVIGPDRFELRADSPLRAEHVTLNDAYRDASQTQSYYLAQLSGSPFERIVQKMIPEQRGLLLIAAIERALAAVVSSPVHYDEQEVWKSRYVVVSLWPQLAGFPFVLHRSDLFELILFLSTRAHSIRSIPAELPTMLEQRIADEAAASPFSEGERFVLHLYRASRIAGPPLGSPSHEIVQLTQLIADGARFFLVPGEAWSDLANADIGALPADRTAAWVAVLRHFLSASAARPSAKWLKTASSLIQSVGPVEASDAFLRWLSALDSGRTIDRVAAHMHDTRTSSDTIEEENAICLRGILWAMPGLAASVQSARAIGAAALSAYRKVRGVGPRAVKVGNAAVYALSQIDTPEAVAQLALLKVRVKFGTAQKEIEKALNATAARVGILREDLEEMSVPAYGLTDVGIRSEQFGDFTAELVIAGGVSTELRWKRADGKPQKSTPAAVKEQFAADLKELSQAAKDIQKMLPAQRERLDQLFLAQKSWPLATWRERYFDHPLIGTLARRLIWRFTQGDRTVDAVWHDGAIRDVAETVLDWLKPETSVQIWHPLAGNVDEVLAWRRWFESHQVRQPFKQAHREIYILTDAERSTATYSNRYAAHILRQHQFNALCAARGWKNKLRLMVDAEYPPATLELPKWNLRAEYWIEGIGDVYQADLNESGVYHRIATDQVRFYPLGAPQVSAHAGGGGYGIYQQAQGNPIPLEHIPALVLSEVLRDVDLFVGVASIGNDPAWQDGGPENRHRDYWREYAFGDLTATAETRRTVLETLIPRLKIAARCSFSDKFLIVRGDLRTYKIHLGSANILMEPNDQYLCIVPGRSPSLAGPTGKLFLPFEGDERLSIILSKALMLADDTKITDPTITRQIRA